MTSAKMTKRMHNRN